MLGFFWTFLNPTLQMLVYALLFSVYMQQNLPHYTYFMFVGLLPWTRTLQLPGRRGQRHQ